ncbi:MAG: hypothetical protein SFU91_01600 [Chloroherpetonaceae bacterium]|nr:hypothetical protein [Chloroherpetonaceae bacterium]
MTTYSRLWFLSFVMLVMFSCSDSAQPVEIQPSPIDLNNAVVIKSGTFTGQNSYITSGSVQILRAQDGSHFLKTGEDFRVDGGAGSISIWLSKSSANLQVGNSAANIKLGTIQSRFSGVYTYSIPAPELLDFTHVVTFCDGARVNFGFSQLKNPE